MFHCSMRHAGSPNVSAKPRYIYIITYNHSWLKYRGNYNGPNAQAIIELARKEKNAVCFGYLGRMIYCSIGRIQVTGYQTNKCGKDGSTRIDNIWNLTVDHDDEDPSLIFVSCWFSAKAKV